MLFSSSSICKKREELKFLNFLWWPTISLPVFLRTCSYMKILVSCFMFCIRINTSFVSVFNCSVCRRCQISLSCLCSTYMLLGRLGTPGTSHSCSLSSTAQHSCLIAQKWSILSRLLQRWQPGKMTIRKQMRQWLSPANLCTAFFKTSPEVLG